MARRGSWLPNEARVKKNIEQKTTTSTLCVHIINIIYIVIGQIYRCRHSEGCVCVRIWDLCVCVCVRDRDRAG